MSTSFLRVAGTKRKTRSESICPIIGSNLDAFRPSMLPSKSDILRNINYKKEISQKAKFQSSDWTKLFKEIKSEVIEIWNNGCIPVCDEYSVEIRIRNLYEKDYLPLKKSQPYYEKNEGKKKIWLDSISQDLSVCFDIAACDHLKKAKSKQEVMSLYSSCRCVSAKKIPEEELEFYASQKFDRGSDSILVIGSKIDLSTTEKYRKKRPRLSKSPTPSPEASTSNESIAQSIDNKSESGDTSDKESIEESDDDYGEGEKSYCNQDYTAFILYGMRAKLSDRQIAGSINLMLICLGITDKRKFISKTAVNYRMKQLGQKLREDHSKIKGYISFSFDGRKDTNPLAHSKSVKQENVSIICGITKKYINHVQPTDGSSLTLAIELFRVCIETESEDLLTFINADGCPVNVGGGDKQEGAIFYLEKMLQRNLIILICLLHLNELVLRHLMLDCWGFKTSGPYNFADDLGKIIKALKDNLKEILNFEKIKTKVPLDLPSELLEKGSDQEYLYKIFIGIHNGKLDPSFLDESFVKRSPGNIGFARWLTIILNAARLYVQMTRPRKGKINEMGLNLDQYLCLKRLVTYGSQVYAPMFFEIKQKWHMKNGSLNYHKLLTETRSFCKRDEFTCVKEVLTTNGFFAAGENILMAAMLGDDLSFRKKALAILKKIKNPNKLKKFLVPKGNINFKANHYFDLLDFDKLLKDRGQKYLRFPAIFQDIPIDKLTKHANGEEELIIPSIFCHNVNIERQVKAMTNVTKNPRAITHADQQALLLATEQSINKVGTNATKKDFLKK